MTDKEIKKLIIDYSCYGITDEEKLKAMTETERDKFRQFYNEFLNTQRCAIPM